MNHLKTAVSLIEHADRYYSHGRFFADFIDDWAYQQTGIYPPSTPLRKEVQEIATELTHTVRDAWETVPGEDFLAHVIEEAGGSGHLSFFQTPPSISLLMTKMLGGSKKLEDFSDICMGSGSLTLAYIHQTFLDGGATAVSRLNIYGEDLSGNKVKVAMLQILNLLDILGGDRPLYVHSMKLSEINSLSREVGIVQYHFSGPNNPTCHLDEQQRSLIEQAVKCGIPEEVISQRLRVPLNLIKQAQQGSLITLAR